jgi:hypothetical protein
LMFFSHARTMFGSIDLPTRFAQRFLITEFAD